MTKKRQHQAGSRKNNNNNRVDLKSGSNKIIASNDTHLWHDKADDALLLELAFLREQALLRYCGHPLFCHADDSSLYFVGVTDRVSHGCKYKTANDQTTSYPPLSNICDNQKIDKHDIRCACMKPDAQ